MEDGSDEVGEIGENDVGGGVLLRGREDVIEGIEDSKREDVMG